MEEEKEKQEGRRSRMGGRGTEENRRGEVKENRRRGRRGAAHPSSTTLGVNFPAEKLLFPDFVLLFMH